MGGIDCESTLSCAEFGKPVCSDPIHGVRPHEHADSPASMRPLQTLRVCLRGGKTALNGSGAMGAMPALVVGMPA